MTRQVRFLDRTALARLLQVEEDFVAALEAREIIAPDPVRGFDRVAVERVRVSWELRRSFGVELAGLEVALALLERWQDERRRVHALLRELERMMAERG